MKFVRTTAQILMNRFSEAIKNTPIGYLSAILVSLLLTGCSEPSKKLHKPVSPMPESFYHAPADELKANFKAPPDAVKPWVYWYWINDHISKEGVENDLKKMQEQGISTALIGIIHLQPSIGGYGKLKPFTDEWWDVLLFAIKKAPEYNIDIGLFNSPGWSQSGGPWVEMHQSMRYLDNREYHLVGGQNTNLSLNKPEGYAEDVKVIAFKTPAGELIRLNNNQTKVSATALINSEKHVEANIEGLLDGDHQSVYYFPASVLKNKGSKLNIDFVHDEILTARSLEIYPNDTHSAKATLSFKNAQGEFETIRSFDLQRPRNMASIGPEHDAPIVINFPKVAASEFRLTLNSLVIGRKSRNSNPIPGIKELVLTSGYKLERYVEKKLGKVFPNPQPKHDSYQWDAPTPEDQASLALNAEQVLDITEFVDEGKLNWQAPAGDWTVVHYFMRTTGTTNGPTTKATRGPEIDKLSKEIAQAHFDAYVGDIYDRLKPEERSALKYIVIDSYERGAQNWTDGFAERFQQQFGYDPMQFLPVYTGRIVNSAEQSERFLWDMRRMVADRVSYEYTAGIRERAHQHGLKLWLENYGHWGFPGEFLQYGGQADIVSGEFWASGNLGAIELKAASSAAHIYGHKTVMSESFTAGRSDAFKNHFWNFKKRGDWSFVEGINHTLLHVYIQQGYEDKKPGVNAWFGSEFNRHNTWFDYMGGWLDYVKRSNYMMQQGTYVADIMYFIGENAPTMTGEIKPALPSGYSYDFINAEIILHGLSVDDGQFVLSSGARFKLLVLPDFSTMRPAVLAKIKQLVADGGAIYGPKPTQSPSLQNYPQADQQVQQLANELWQQIDGKTVTQGQYGKGMVFFDSAENVDLTQVMNKLKQPADLAGLPEEVIWSHRSSDTHEIYFIANQSEAVVDIKPSFRLQSSSPNKLGQPQAWDAVTGNVRTIGQYSIENDRLVAPITLQGLQSTFVVFEKSVNAAIQPKAIKEISKQDKDIWLPTAIDNTGEVLIDVPQNGDYQVQLTNGQTQNVELTDLPSPLALNTPWQLTFEQNRDVATSLTLDKLVSLTELKPLALKHYSGSISYQNQFNMSADMLRNDQRWILHLGQVGVVARVTINGYNLGEIWSRPLQVDVTDYLVAGNNKLKVDVATTWVNRMVGDLKYPKQFPDQKQPKVFETEITFESKISKDTELQASGLIGPVLLQPIRKITLKL
ncbi:family 2 glycoside hydrolase [Catenovulum agarivorans DS-2]|uniref:Family 2 glycoside hydrolase n=1 Tax=Catenovulum agarivorans DS-2 TaxID=1328313 RepID=W7QPG4_9ALTE|nr:glycosyl hydrolase [Catenovulum agarivorans]EWH09788.1 family 2 glycoside hydrolase [Catenovulum agarivorans DS-2]